MSADLREAPASGQTRIPSLDVLRGIAILGTLASNISLFGMSTGIIGTVIQGQAVPGDEALLLALDVRSVMTTLVNGVFLALLTIMFGVGVEIQRQSAVRRGLAWPGRYIRRAALLFVEGAVHFVLVFAYDVLMFYAIVSLIVAFTLRHRAWVIRAVMIGAAIAHVAVTYFNAGPLFAVTSTSQASTEGSVDFLPSQASGYLPTGASPGYLDQVLHRIDPANLPLNRMEFVYILFLGIALFLAGAMLVRANVLVDTERGRRIRFRLMVVGFGVGVPLRLLADYTAIPHLPDSRYLVAPFLAFGLLAAVAGFCLRRPVNGPVRRGLTAVGRTALSCYVGQNVLASVALERWGLDLRPWLEPLGQWADPLAWAVLSALLVALALLWLRWFERGPLELVMHRLLAGRTKTVQPVELVASDGDPSTGGRR
ncbi:DUF418 domain-containing protein [Rhizohabitans arisaemae]|uniref:DUF418 domain-containing protein n=1 Tax=Rhizohabitans arisaemae TaxID=2720610 RepID=UPI0024B243A9|nr:DUF418 domain-containing protein [Rhizohabitans arisaemae]